MIPRNVIRSNSYMNMSHILILREHKSRAFYRIQATRNMTGGGDIIKAKGDKVAEAKSMAGDVSQVVSQSEQEDPTRNIIQFFPKDYRVSSNQLEQILTSIRLWKVVVKQL